MKLSELIITLQEVLSLFGDVPVVHGDMTDGAHIEVITGEAVAEPEKYPKGFVHIGADL